MAGLMNTCLLWDYIVDKRVTFWGEKYLYNHNDDDDDDDQVKQTSKYITTTRTIITFNRPWQSYIYDFCCF